MEQDERILYRWNRARGFKIEHTTTCTRGDDQHATLDAQKNLNGHVCLEDYFTILEAAVRHDDACLTVHRRLTRVNVRNTRRNHADIMRPSSEDDVTQRDGKEITETAKGNRAGATIRRIYLAPGKGKSPTAAPTLTTTTI